MVEGARTAGWDVLRVDVDVGETECAVDCGGGEEGEQADEEEQGRRNKVESSIVLLSNFLSSL